MGDPRTGVKRLHFKAHLVSFHKINTEYMKTCKCANRVISLLPYFIALIIIRVKKKSGAICIQISTLCILFPYLRLVAVLQGSQVAHEAHSQAAPLLRLHVARQAVQQDARVPGAGQQPQDLRLRKSVRLQERSGKRARWGKMRTFMKSSGNSFHKSPLVRISPALL